METNNLIPITSTEQARILGRIGGSKSTPEKKLAAKLRELKKKGLTDETTQKIYELMTDSNMSDLDILLLIESMKAKAKTVTEKEKACRMLLEWRKLRYGSKVTVESTSKNLNVDITYALTPDEIANIVQDTGQ